MLRNSADWRSVFLVVLVTANLFVQWSLPEPNGWLIALSVVLALPLAAMGHNQNHQAMFRPAWMNVAMSYWLSFFYGLPTISWIAVHNWTHHGYVNVAGKDATSTHNAGDRSDLWGVLLYTPTSMGPFFRAHKEAFTRFWHRSPGRFAYYLSHIVFLYGMVALLLVVDLERALLYVVLPQQAAIVAITVFNYCQHVHTDGSSRYNLSRNFTSPILNAYLFNAGFHTAHHLDEGAHWSTGKEVHARIASQIDPRLEEPSFWAYFARRIVLGTFSRRFQTQPLQPAPAATPVAG